MLNAAKSPRSPSDALDGALRATLPPGDAELVALAQQLAELQVRVDETNAECEAASDRYQAIKMVRPRTLLWRLGDPVSYSRNETFVEGGKRFLWCDLSEIKAWREAMPSFEQWLFCGTDEERDALGLVNYESGLPAPIAGYEHLFYQNGGKKHGTRQAARAAELLKALNEWDAADEAAYKTSGLQAAEKASDDAVEAQSPVLDRMMQIQPSTVEGLRALASALVVYCWNGKIKESEYTEEGLIARIVSNLTGLPIGKPEQVQ